MNVPSSIRNRNVEPQAAVSVQSNQSEMSGFLHPLDENLASRFEGNMSTMPVFNHYGKESVFMNRLVLTSRVGSDGTLRLDVPLGLAEADHEVRVTVEPVANQKSVSATEWEAWVDEMAGSLQGEFQRPQHCDLEVRDSL